MSGRNVKMVDTFWKSQMMGIESRAAVARNWGLSGQVLLVHCNEGIWGFVCDGTLLCLDCGGSDVTVCMCLNL